MDAKMLMLCHKVEHEEFGADEAYDLKLDGIRSLVSKKGRKVEILSRYNNRIEDRFPEVVEELREVDGDFIVDGEMTVLKGLSGTLTKLEKRNVQNKLMRELLKDELPATFYAFDVLSIDGDDVRGKPLAQRRALLNKLIQSGEHVKVLQLMTAKGSIQEVLDKHTADGWEGIVVKKLRAPYTPGRSSNFLKAKKSDTVNVDIIGATVSDKGKPFASLVLAKDGEYYGKCGNGFGKPDLAQRQKILDRMKGTNNIPIPRDVERKLLVRCAPIHADIRIQEELDGPRFPVLDRIRWG